MDIDFFENLSNAPLAFIIGASFILGCALIILFYAQRYKEKTEKERFWNRTALFAEILTSIGIIGLITFTGRVKLEEEKIQANESSQAAQIALIAPL